VSVPERINGGQALVAIGAIALVVSLFLHWFEPGRSAWTVFEVWDIVLAAIGIAAIAAIVPARRGDVRDEHIVPERWLPALAGAALVIVVVSLINHPPAAAARGSSPEAGAWLALAAAIVLSAGAILSRARISLVISLRASDRTSAPPPPPAAPEPEPPDSDFESDTATQPLPPRSRT
jgi:peptidoglycan/LPS O-acetylase OafA/YrhL